MENAVIWSRNFRMMITILSATFLLSYDDNKYFWLEFLQEKM